MAKKKATIAPKARAAQLRRIDELGKQIYGDRWDDVRTATRSGLTPEGASTVIYEFQKILGGNV
jgi:hypothetical protein